MDILKIIVPTVLTFFIGIFITPFFTRYFYKYKMWKKSARIHSDTSEEFGKIHNTEHDVSTPRVGGVIIWVSVALTVMIIFCLSLLFPLGLFGGEESIFNLLNFFSRSQTVVPLGAFFLAALIGLVDDLLQIFGRGNYARDPLIYRKIKIVFVTLIGLAIGSVIAFLGHQYDISALAGAIAGGILAFLWFNVPPARFYMGESGVLALTVVLSVMAFLTDAVLLLPIIALPLVATSLSVIIQMIGYKYFGHKRVFKVAPLHHHFQALGWPREKVVMRYWIVSVICAITGVILYIIS